jgi:hypothetical protein
MINNLGIISCGSGQTLSSFHSLTDFFPKEKQTNNLLRSCFLLLNFAFFSSLLLKCIHRDEEMKTFKVHIFYEVINDS